MIQVNTYNIDYDAPSDANLPTALSFEFPEGTEDLETEASDAISDHTGFCHHGFDFETASQKETL